MNNYCGFIEVWSNGIETRQHSTPKETVLLKNILRRTKEMGLKTVAIFKISLK